MRAFRTDFVLHLDESLILFNFDLLVLKLQFQ